MQIEHTVFLSWAISVPTTMRITTAVWVTQIYGWGYWKFEISIFYINLLKTLQLKALTAISHIAAIGKHREIEGEVNQSSHSLLQACCLWAHRVHHLSVIFENTLSTLTLQGPKSPVLLLWVFQNLSFSSKIKLPKENETYSCPWLTIFITQDF